MPRSIDEPDIVFVAEFALGELQKLSDSGIYRTLSLDRIVSAATQDGIFHMNTFLSMQFSSPYFKSGALVEVYEVMVMRHKEDGTFSFAIDDFPEMDDDAIERFWIQKVEEHRRSREEAFRQMELDILTEMDNEGHDPSSTDQAETNDSTSSSEVFPELTGMTSTELFQVLSQDLSSTDEGNKDRRRAALEVIDGRWDHEAKELHDELSKMKTSSLYQITTSPTVVNHRKLVAEKIIEGRLHLMDQSEPAVSQSPPQRKKDELDRSEL
uniref:Uncharacterized protein n=1 Tax=Octactis speculum TaxID=3111310 RepID=A0A7S2CNQ6_9STRA|eukprot:CAMPEP_0185779460 /NCGR_PEP_ID=MMETSP1174-20130828/95878_1 /TAXON_ID=35687 /ORGANISM="Dictyocha speculum, Strain CCMP1381" /LENGTH=267 /DNA_ID=CAMNT_0028468631 /DNA_START=123 /DNA_END=926 /DNA_ORIENTATION=+